MEIKGIVKKIYPIQEGISKSSGENWKTMEFVIEETGAKYPQSAVLQLWNDNCTRFQLEQGKKVIVQFDIKCREYEGKSYNTLTAWNVTEMR